MSHSLELVGHCSMPATDRKPNNFVKSVRFAPDGTQVLVTSDDRAARLYASADRRLCARLQVDCGDAIYDSAWHPSAHPGARCFVTSARDHPLRLWDADSRALRASYVPLDNAFEPTAAVSCAFSDTGAQLFAGFANRVCIFDVAAPTAAPRDITTYHRKFRPHGVAGIVSAFAIRGAVYAIGAYGGGIGLLDQRSDADAMALFNCAHAGGITQLQFSPNGLYMFSGARKDAHLICWDLRTQTPLCRFRRHCDTNQRLQFDVSPSGEFLLTPSGNQLDVYDLVRGDLVAPAPCATRRFASAVNSVSMHPEHAVVAVGTGERQPEPLHLAPDANQICLLLFRNAGSV
jgi:WD40 repeat protein